MISFKKIVYCVFFILVSNVIFAASIIIDLELPDNKLSYPIQQTIEPVQDTEIEDLNFNPDDSVKTVEPQKEQDQLFELNDLEEDTADIESELIINDSQETTIIDDVNQVDEPDSLSEPIIDDGQETTSIDDVNQADEADILSESIINDSQKTIIIDNVNQADEPDSLSKSKTNYNQEATLIEDYSNTDNPNNLTDNSSLFVQSEKFDIDFFTDSFFNVSSKLIPKISPSPLKPQSFYCFLGPVYKSSFKVPDIPIYTNKKINGLIRLYTQRKIKVLKRAIERSATYLGMMRRIFREYQLPENLVYLAIVESNLNSKARSKANALGIWQFMRHTGRIFNLNQSWWHEDRYDPVKSTHAAARYLTNLHRQFKGDWELALAGYNSGSGRVRKAQRKAKRLKKNPLYWNLDLPRETRGYVPAFYAVANLFSDLEKYGFETIPALEKEQKMQTLEVPGGVSLSEIARVFNIEYQNFKKMNPSLIKGMTPATLTTYTIKIPATINIENKQLEKIDLLKQFRQKFWKHHKVRKGDTLWAISRKYRIPISKIKAFNQFRRKNLLRIGQKIMLPVPNEWKENQIAKATIPNLKKAKETLDKMPGVTYVHEVEKGDTLWNIAQRFNVSIRSIKSWNRGNLTSRILQIGTKLFIKMPVDIAKSINSIKL